MGALGRRSVHAPTRGWTAAGRQSNPAVGARLTPRRFRAPKGAGAARLLQMWGRAFGGGLARAHGRRLTLAHRQSVGLLFISR
jgi:hypothetical protein